MDITFVIVAYNQEKRIIEALESVKYQVLNYLQGKDVQLIIADDCSKDKTVYNTKKWLEVNSSLFARIDFEIAEKNRGTCKNIANAYRSIKAERFMSLAADDLVADVDVYSILDSYGKNEIVACVPYVFSDKKIIRSRERYMWGIIPYFFSKEQIYEMSRRDSVLMNGGFYSSCLLNESILDFMEQFQLLDDQPRYFQMLNENKDIKYNCCSNPILMYRVSEEQVTNQKGVYWKRIIHDKKKLIKFTIKEEPKWSNRFSILLSLLAMVRPKLYAYVFSSMDSSIRRNRNIMNEKRKDISDLIDDILREDIIIEKEKYLLYIQNNSRQFIEEC